MLQRRMPAQGGGTECIMIVVDSHCDTAGRLLQGETLASCKGQWSLERARKYSGFVQFFAAFIPPEEQQPEAYCMALLDAVTDELHHNGLRAATAYRTLETDLTQNGFSCLLAVEGGCGDRLETVERLFQKGVRVMSLCWNEDTPWCGGCQGEGGGLTAAGRKAVAEMNRLGMLMDVSHCSDQSFADLAALSQKPLIATHSNAREICPHPRNLTREQFCMIRDRGGMVGLNLYPPFLSGSDCAVISDLLRHIDYFLSLGGEDHIGFGADFDGIDSCMFPVSGIESYEWLSHELEKHYSESIVKKLFYENYFTFLKKNL